MPGCTPKPAEAGDPQAARRASPVEAWAFNGKPPQRCSSAASRVRDRSAGSAAARRAARPASGGFIISLASDGIAPRCASAASGRRQRSGSGGGVAPGPLDGGRRAGGRITRRPSLPIPRPGSTAGRLQQDGGQLGEAPCQARAVRGCQSANALAGAPRGLEGRARAWCERSVGFAPPDASTVISSFLQDGLWWEWQTRGPSGWSSLEAAVSEKLEEAYTLGEPRCRFWQDGTLVEFDLRGAIGAVGSSHLRRVRMPQTEDNTVSTCSTCWTSPGATHELEAQESTLTFPSRWADADNPHFYSGDVSQEMPASPGKDTLASSMEHSTGFSQWLQS